MHSHINVEISNKCVKRLGEEVSSFFFFNYVNWFNKMEEGSHCFNALLFRELGAYNNYVLYSNTIYNIIWEGFREKEKELA
jgi:hypothetical protein